jgi:hypothetical protein
VVSAGEAVIQGGGGEVAGERWRGEGGEGMAGCHGSRGMAARTGRGPVMRS